MKTNLDMRQVKRALGRKDVGSAIDRLYEVVEELVENVNKLAKDYNKRQNEVRDLDARDRYEQQNEDVQNLEKRVKKIENIISEALK